MRMSQRKQKSRVGILIHQIKKKPFDLIKYIFLAYATIWVILEPILAVVDTAGAVFKGNDKVVTLVIVSVIYGFYKILPVLSIEIPMHHHTMKLRVCFKNLFDHDGTIVVPVSKRLYETDVFPSSIQAALIGEGAGKLGKEGALSQYVEEVTRSLAQYPHDFQIAPFSADDDPLLGRVYPIGTACKVNLELRKSILLAITDTERAEYMKPNNGNVQDLWLALGSLWQTIHETDQGEKIGLPLLGSGIVGIELPPKDILLLNIIAIKSSLLQFGTLINREIVIYLHESVKTKIDLEEVKNVFG